MGRTLTTALAGALVALAIVGSFLALDRTVLHVYTDEGSGTMQGVETAWYYVEVRDAGRVTKEAETDLPMCRWLFVLRPDPVPAEPHALPRTIDGIERIALECRK